MNYCSNEGLQRGGKGENATVYTNLMTRVCVCEREREREKDSEQ